MDLGLAGKRVLVTGATGGIGAAVARSFLGEGARVLVAARRSTPLEALASVLAKDASGRVHACAFDFGSLDSVAHLADEVERTMGGADVVVLNSGGPPPATAADMTPSSLQQWTSLLVVGPVTLATRMLPGMRAQRFGRLVVVSSSGVTQPISDLALSNSARLSLVGWAKTAAAEVASDGVTINCVIPGRIDTERLRTIDYARAKRLNQPLEIIQQQSRAGIPIGRYGRPEEFADVVTFLGSQNASYATGAMWRVDGGLISSI